MVGLPFYLSLENGIYIMHKARHGGGPIGAHTGVRQPESRLGQHSCLQNKDRSIFRKNIGCRCLHRAQYPYLGTWDMDKTARKNPPRKGSLPPKGTGPGGGNRPLPAKPYLLRPLPDCRERGAPAAGTPHHLHCQACGPLGNWLGPHSPKEKTRRSGLWQVNELGKTPLIPADLELLSGSILK